MRCGVCVASSRGVAGDARPPLTSDRASGIDWTGCLDVAELPMAFFSLGGEGTVNRTQSCMGPRPERATDVIRSTWLRPFQVISATGLRHALWIAVTRRP